MNTKINHNRKYLQLEQYIDLLTDAINADESISGRLKLAREVMETNKDILRVLFKSDVALGEGDSYCQCEFHEIHDNQDCQADKKTTNHYGLYSFPHSRWLCTLCLVQCYKKSVI